MESFGGMHKKISLRNIPIQTLCQVIVVLIKNHVKLRNNENISGIFIE